VSLEADLETVVSSYREAIDRAQQDVNEVTDNLFASMRKQLEDVEIQQIRSWLSSTNMKIKVLASLCNNLSAMEDAFLDLKTRYVGDIDQNAVVSDTEAEQGATCLLDFGKSEETTSP
jgi:hypothetical protein